MSGGSRRVAILGPAPPDRGGIAHETRRLAEELSRLGRVDYFTFSRSYPRWLDPRRYARDAGLPPSPALPALDYRSPRTWAATAGRIAAAAPDALLVPWWTAFWGIPFRAVLRGVGRRLPAVPRVLLCHNVEDHEPHAIKRAITLAAFRAADGYVVHATADGQRIARELPGRPVAVLPLPAPAPPPLSQAEARRALGVDGPLLLFLGLVRPYKGVDLLLAAAPRIVAETGARIAIVGEVFARSRRLEALRAASPVRDRILWVDRYVSEEEMALWLVAADAVAVPYRRVSGSAIAARAIGARRPIVAAAVGGLTDVVVPGSTGETFPPGDADALAGAARVVLARGAAGYAAGLGAAAERMAWPRYAEGILAFLGALTKRL